MCFILKSNLEKTLKNNKEPSKLLTFENCNKECVVFICLSDIFSTTLYLFNVLIFYFDQVNFYYFVQVWDLFYDADSVRTMLSRKIQEESMRTYLFTYSNVYDSISIVSTVLFRRTRFNFNKPFM